MRFRIVFNMEGECHANATSKYFEDDKLTPNDVHCMSESTRKNRKNSTRSKEFYSSVDLDMLAKTNKSKIILNVNAKKSHALTKIHDTLVHIMLNVRKISFFLRRVKIKESQRNK